MTEVYFYHLERRTVESALPDLLARSLQRGWRVAVKVGSAERLRSLDEHLWTFEAASFLAHGSAADGRADAHPIWLTTGDENPNAAQVRFLLDGARTDVFTGYERFVILFDGNDREALAEARETWKAARGASADATYWRQDEAGRWARQGAAA